MRVVADQIKKLEDNIKVYLSFHSYSQLWMYPWGYTSDLPDDWEELVSLFFLEVLCSVFAWTYCVYFSDSSFLLKSFHSYDFTSSLFLLSSLSNPDGGSATVSSISDSELFTQTFVQEFWMVQGLYLPHPHPGNILSYIKSLVKMFPMLSLALDLGTHTVLITSLLLFWKKKMCPDKLFLLYQSISFFPHAGNLPTCNLLQRSVTALLLQTSDL